MLQRSRIAQVLPGVALAVVGCGTPARAELATTVAATVDPLIAAEPTPRPEDAKRLDEYAGEYLSSIACRSCPRDPDSIFTVEARPDGTLSLWGQRWIPAGADLFVRDDGKRSLGFARDADGRVIAVSAGSWRVADRIP